MLEIPGYSTLDLLQAGADVVLLRARRESDQQPVILKIATNRRPGGATIARLQREHRIASTLPSPPALRCLGHQNVGSRPMLVFQDTSCFTLSDQLAREGRLELEEFLRVATLLASAVHAVHLADVIHKDLRPANILLNEAGDTVLLTGFGIAERVSKDGSGSWVTSGPQGSPAYMSPEQTGRMNRGIDVRSDLYSLGVSFCEMLTGQLPFPDGSTIELIHSHIARAPTSPCELDPSLPAILDTLVRKLLEKNREDRYQTAAALQADLQECRERLRGREIEPFELGGRGISDRFILSQRIYGRELERSRLRASLESAQHGGRALWIVSGRAGIGKTVLVHELDGLLEKGHFISGKFGQYSRGRPYSALIDAFDMLARQLMSRSDADLAVWGAELVAVLGSNAAVILDVLPVFEAIIGKQPPAPTLDATEAQNRFHFVFHAFVRSFCKGGAPLLLFLDDMQWADHATVALVEALLSDDDTGNLLVIAAIRDHEVSLAHPFSRALRRLGDVQCPIQRVDLGPIGLVPVTQLIADTLSCSTARAEGLARLVVEKTLGNPFFVNRFLSHLWSCGALRFDHDTAAWEWDEAEIRELGITDNVVELMTEKLLEIPPECQRVLRLAACIGSRFDLPTLAGAAGRSEEQVAGLLDLAAVEGLVAVFEYDGGAKGVPTRDYRFGHDRVHQAAYALISEAERPALHLEIGRALLAGLDLAQPDARLFSIVEQLQAGESLLEDREERWQLARLHALAAERAVNSLAFDSALEHVEHALSLVSADSWVVDYAFALKLHTLGATASVMSGAPEKMQAFCDSIFRRAADIYDKLPAYSLLIDYHFSGSEQVAAALDIALDALAELGLKLPRRPNALHTAWYLLRTKLALWGRPVSKLSDNPVMTDRRVQAILRLLVSVDGVAYMANPNSFAIHALVAVRLSQRHGHSSASGWAYNLYGAILCAGLDDIDGGAEIGRFGYQVAKGLDDVWMQSRIATPHLITIAHWTLPMSEMVAPLQEGIEKGMALGAYNPVGANLMYLQMYRLFAGAPLAELVGEQRAAIRFAVAIDQSIAVDFIGLFHDLVVDLVNEEAGIPTADLGAEPLSHFTAGGNKNGIFTVHFVRSMHAYLLGDLEGALQHSDEAAKEEASAAGTILAIQGAFWRGVILASASSLRSPRYVKGQLRKRLKTLRRWQSFCAANIEHKADLLEAELARLEGRHDRAVALFDSAHAKAQRHGFIHEALLCAERAGHWLRSVGSVTTADMWFSDAAFEAERWGSSRVGGRLREGLGQSSPGAGLSREESARGVAVDGVGLDVGTIVRSSQAVLREMDLSKLLDQVMYAAVENAGAERGALILVADDSLSVEVRYPVEEGRAIPLEAAQGIAAGIVNLVRRSLQPVVLDDAQQDVHLSRDPHVQKAGVRSVLCLPLINQNDLIAILYLENNLTPAAFTPARINLLTLLAAQAAISIRNARLYSEQVKLTRAYSRFVPRAFLEQLGRKSIVDVELGDQVEREMAVLFSDIRSFTTVSEGLSPAENFAFINEFLGCVSPVIRQHGGFIDKYIGDAIMALFPRGATDACRAAVAMQVEVVALNERRRQRGEAPIAIGVGLHLGRLMLGTVGEAQRMEGTVISDVVNVASRIEGLTKVYGSSVLLSSQVVAGLDVDSWDLRDLGREAIRGKSRGVQLFELMDAEPEGRRSVKEANRAVLARAVDAMSAGRWEEGQEILGRLDSDAAEDGAIGALLARCRSRRDLLVNLEA